VCKDKQKIHNLNCDVSQISLARLIDACLHQLNVEDCNRNLSETAVHSVPWIAVFKVIICGQVCYGVTCHNTGTKNVLCRGLVFCFHYLCEFACFYGTQDKITVIAVYDNVHVLLLTVMLVLPDSFLSD
jgi:hypothetical protein